MSRGAGRRREVPPVAPLSLSPLFAKMITSFFFLLPRERERARVPRLDYRELSGPRVKLILGLIRSFDPASLR